jgi:hypothetical protein
MLEEWWNILLLKFQQSLISPAISSGVVLYCDDRVTFVVFSSDVF